MIKGDWRFFWTENIQDFISPPTAWDSSFNTGLGQSQLSSLWITSYFNFTAFFSKLGLSWDVISLLFWILPAILLSFFSSFSLFNYLFKDKVKYSLLAGIIYTFNTYFLMILTGGQLGVALSYSMVPLVFLTFIKLFKKLSLRNALISGLALGFQIIFDPRIVLIAIVAIFLYLIFNFRDIIKIIKNLLTILIVPLVIAGFMNIFWILPLLLAKSFPIPHGFDSSSGFRFFSFAEFSNAISLLHPNWPENIFGKIYFLDPKFIILPIIAFGSLFSKNKIILYFLIVSLLGIFLAKGANPPFGEINIWIFENLPGMSVFRDPTKWYILIILGYSILIPYSLKEISRFFKFAPLLFIVYFLFLLSPIFGQIKIQQVPQEYVQLKDFLFNEKRFSRTLWIPQWQRFGYFSNNHPAIGREEVLKGNYKKQIKQLGRSEDLLRDLSIKYVIIPYDSVGEIFLDGRKYNEKFYLESVKKVENIEWLKRVGGFEKLAVFEVSSLKDHFWASSEFMKINYKFINPTEYQVRVENAEKGDVLVFSEGFDKSWIAESSKFKVQSSKLDMLNSFKLPESGNYELKVYFVPQKYVVAGLWVSGFTLLASVAYLLFGKIRKKW